jgi:hypothetical protein
MFLEKVEVMTSFVGFAAVLIPWPLDFTEKANVVGKARRRGRRRRKAAVAVAVAVAMVGGAVRRLKNAVNKFFHETVRVVDCADSIGIII